ncbi:cation transporter, partial [Enterobacter cloacae subsp. cloacae]|nr:cation transporter [Enterobacter cloacae subsp. cloacae]
MVVHGLGQYSGGAGGLVDGYCRPLTNLLVVRYSLQPADEEHTFERQSRIAGGAGAKYALFPALRCFCFNRHSASCSPSPMNDPGVGVVVTVAALICTLVLVTFQRWVVRKTQSQAVRADMLHYQSDVMMNGAILIALGLARYGWHRADA